MRALVIDGKLSMGHARALLKSDNMTAVAQQIVDKGLSVRQAEALMQKSRGRKKATKPHNEGSADIKAIESHLGDLLGLKVNIEQGKDGVSGAVNFEYKSLDQLDMLCQRLTGEPF